MCWQLHNLVIDLVTLHVCPYSATVVIKTFPFFNQFDYIILYLKNESFSGSQALEDFSRSSSDSNK